MDKRTALGALAAMLAGGYAKGSYGQQKFSFAGQQVKFVVAYAPGGVADVTARLLLSNLASAIGAQSVIVENRAGANGNIGTEYVARQAADGLTYAVLPATQMIINPLVPELRLKTLDINKLLQPVVSLADVPLALVVSKESTITTIEQFIAAARAGQLRIGNPSNGTSHHLAALLLEKANNLTFVHVPYKGGAPMISDLAGGHIDACISSVTSAEALVKAGRLRWVGTTQAGPPRPWHGVPSLLPHMNATAVPAWIGIFAATGTPPGALGAVHAAVQAASQSPPILARFQELGLEPMPLTSIELQSRLREEADFMRAFLKDVKIDFSS